MGLEICIGNKLPSDGDDPGPGTPLAKKILNAPLSLSTLATSSVELHGAVAKVLPSLMAQV